MLSRSYLEATPAYSLTLLAAPYCAVPSVVPFTFFGGCVYARGVVLGS